MKTRIGHYDIVTELGRGGMGIVYKGHETALNRYVAIKVLSPSLAHDEGIKERFLREARSMAALNDPHIIQVYFIGEDEGQPYFAMEFVDGESLSSYLKREGRLTPEQSARAIYQTAQGLTTAHDKGVIHRDIKPGNLMLDQKGRIKIADFGIALQNDLSKKLTSTGEFVGTPGYLSPEVCTGQRVDQRSDIFSLGIVLFELLTGRMPFTDESPLGLMLEVVRAEIPDVRQINAEVDAELVAVLQRMTAKDPNNRYSDCHQLVADLARHPLVSGAQTVTARPVLSPAASTVIGMKTPISGQSQLPSYASQGARAPTPAPMSAAHAPATVVTPPPVSAPPARPSVLESQDRRERKTSMVMPIAAVLVLGAAAAGAYAMRDSLPFLKSSGTEPASSLASTTTTTAPATVAAVAAPPPVAVAAPPPPAPPVLGEPPVPTTAVAEPPTTSLLTGAGAPESNVATPVPTQEADLVASNDTQPPAAQDGRAPLQADQSEEDPQAIGPLRRLAEARRGALAKASPPEQPSQPARPAGPPKVVVVAFGDPAITGPAEQIVEESLLNAGLIVADEEVVPGLADMIGSGRADLPRLFAMLVRAGNVRAVTVIRAEPLGSTQLQYYGQLDTLYSVNLTVRSYDIATREQLGGGIRSKVDFTQLNAENNTREAIEPELNRLNANLSRYRPKGNGG